VAQKTFRTSACVIQPHGQNESAQKHLCNYQISTNMCRIFVYNISVSAVIQRK